MSGHIRAYDQGGSAQEDRFGMPTVMIKEVFKKGERCTVAHPPSKLLVQIPSCITFCRNLPTSIFGIGSAFKS